MPSDQLDDLAAELFAHPTVTPVRGSSVAGLRYRPREASEEPA